MNNKALYCVVTTIQEPTTCLRALSQSCREAGAAIIVIGDAKGPARFSLEQATFYPLEAQRETGFRLASKLPTGHYARKNLGYLLAMQSEASCIYETDDDNMPKTAWQTRALTVQAQAINVRPWANVYRYFSDDLIWPRGFPLELVSSARTYERRPAAPIKEIKAPVQQGLADLSPDVDAVWRLLYDREAYFWSDRPSVWLPPGTWCPFNSQSTWWWPSAYPLLYLPSYCSFRMTDIWRSFVAQRCLWEAGYGVVFHPPEVIQSRNEHHLMNDFRDEVSGYVNNLQIADVLRDLKLRPGLSHMAENVIICYDALIERGYLGRDEMCLLEAWVRDVADLIGARPPQAEQPTYTE